MRRSFHSASPSECWTQAVPQREAEFLCGNPRYKKRKYHYKTQCRVSSVCPERFQYRRTARGRHAKIEVERRSTPFRRGIWTEGDNHSEVPPQSFASRSASFSPACAVGARQRDG